MWGRGRTVGLVVILLVALLGVASWQYTQRLELQREARIAVLLNSPEYAHCLYDASTCPQIEGTVQVPDLLGLAVIILALVVAGYLYRSDQIQQRILRELRASDEREHAEKELSLVLSVLRQEEQKVLLAVREQPGITQNTLRLRTGFSKAKLSMLLKELEARGLVTKTGEGKTNALHLKRKL